MIYEFVFRRLIVRCAIFLSSFKGEIGYGPSARGVLFVIVGGFFAYAASSICPEQADSMADALNWLRRLPFGGALYGIVAVGLASFGTCNLIQARYRLVSEPAITHEVRNAARTAASLAGFNR